MVQVIFEITYNCPCRCKFCPIRRMGLRGKLLPLTDYERILTLFKRYYDDTCYAAVLSGGEPATVSFLKDYVEAAHRHGYTCTIVTNGFNPRRVVEARPDLVEVSIDYFGPRHDLSRGYRGLFNKAMSLVMEASKAGIPVVLRSTAMKDNIGDILKLREYLDVNNLEHVPILVMPVRGAPELKPSQEQLQKLQRKGIILSDNCPAGISSFVVTPDREILACIFYRKKLGQFTRFTREELEQALQEGAKLPRYPCENLT